VSKWTTREGVDNAIRERDVEYIVHAIRHPETPQEVRDYLADFVRDFPNGKAKFSRRRPKRRGLEWERLKIAERVWWVKKSKGLKKTSSAVDEVAKELRCSTTTVWNCWHGFDPDRYEESRDEGLLDALRDEADEARWESTIESLKDEYGPGKEFTDEEIEAVAKEPDECGRDYDD
jgi:hypothetical protein